MTEALELTTEVAPTLLAVCERCLVREPMRKFSLCRPCVDEINAATVLLLRRGLEARRAAQEGGQT